MYTNPLLTRYYPATHPHQLCFFVRGSSCAATEVDYYLLPSELEDAYLNATPAADSATTISAPTAATTSATGAAGTTTVSGSTESITTATTTVATDRTADSTTTTTADNTTTTTASLSPSLGSSAVSPKKPLRVRVRPPWLETYSEQVVLLDWPLLVPQVRLFALSSLLSGFVLNFIVMNSVSALLMWRIGLILLLDIICKQYKL